MWVHPKAQCFLLEMSHFDLVLLNIYIYIYHGVFNIPQMEQFSEDENKILKIQ